MCERYGMHGCGDVVGSTAGQGSVERIEERVETRPDEQIQEMPAEIAIDPRILDGSWQLATSAELSMITPVAAPAMHLHTPFDAEAELLLTPVKPVFGTYRHEPLSPFQTAVSPACAVTHECEAVRATTKPAAIHQGSPGVLCEKAGRKKGSKISTEEQKLRKREYDRKRRERMKMASK